MTVEHVFLTENKTEVFYLGGKIGDAECSLMLSKKGGVPIMMDKSATGSDSEAADEENAEKDDSTQAAGRDFYEQKAVEYMQKLGFENLKAVWYNPTDGAAVINLAPGNRRHNLLHRSRKSKSRFAGRRNKRLRVFRIL